MIAFEKVLKKHKEKMWEDNNLIVLSLFCINISSPLKPMLKSLSGFSIYPA